LRVTKTRLNRFQGRFCDYLKTKTRDVNHRALQYLQGQILENKAVNMTNIPKIVPDSDNQSLQHFISESMWDEDGVITEIQNYASELIGDENNASLHVDESGFPKQGKNSVGVARQYCGRLGKVDNCQVGVFLGYTNEGYRTIIDKRLYLPREWMKDIKRRRKCHVPEDTEFKTKAELGLDMVLGARGRGVPFGWVGMDCFYGEQPWFLDRLDDEDIIYIADIPCDTRVWLEKPKTEVPQRKGNKGRRPRRERLVNGEPKPMQVQEIAMLESVQWHHIFIRDTERKELWSCIVCLRVYPVRDELPGEQTWLIIRKNDGENEIKYQLSNAPLDTSVERLGKMSASRYWIERALQDAKGGVGMADYQVRGWWGWHHHMTMTLLAMLFLLELLIDLKEKAPKLTIQDVREILEVILPKRNIGGDEILEILEQKLKARESARRSHHKRNRM
jgi:SRSO17 transposase